VQPTGLLLTAVLMFVSDSSDPWRLVARYVDALAPGSYLALSHLTDDYKPPVTAERFRAVFDQATERLYFRSQAGIARFFDGMELVPPYEGARARPSATRGSGAPRIRCSRTATARDGSTAGWPGSRDRQAHGRRTRYRSRRASLAALGSRRRRDRDRLRARDPRLGTSGSGQWVLMRVTGDPEQRVLVFDRHEWECFLDGARNGEFDDAGNPAHPTP
jgi:hypothetical protein